MNNYEEIKIKYLQYLADFNTLLEGVNRTFNKRKYLDDIFLFSNDTSPVKNDDSSIEQYPGEMKKIFRELCLRYHPDKGGDPEKFIIIYELYKNGNVKRLRQIHQDDNFEEKIEGTTSIRILEPQVIDEELEILMMKSSDCWMYYTSLSEKEKEFIMRKYINSDKELKFTMEVLNKMAYFILTDVRFIDSMMRIYQWSDEWEG